MIYNEACGERLSRLGFGCMRLPLGPDGEIDEARLNTMVDMAIEQGVNYFDTAWPYHGGKSELAVGKALSRHSRSKWFLASKYPGHQISSSYDPAALFEKQLQKCRVEYFDFYLLHNVCESSLPTYSDPRWGIVEYFKQQKKLGRIRHLGFSTHARAENLPGILDMLSDCAEFCQIQLNYLDWTLQDARAKYELLCKRGVPVWVMEPLRGGKLSQPSPKDAARLQSLRPDATPSQWSFDWLMGLENVKMVLSGMSEPEQMRENIQTFSRSRPLSEQEQALLMDIAEGLKTALPCTRCRYCTEGCPMGLDIPMLIHALNDLRYAGSMTVPMQLDALPEDKRPSACVGCGACAAICPQKIDIPAAMKELTQRISAMPSWAEQCRQREEAARRLQNA